MLAAQDIRQTAPGLDRARRVLRAQLGALVRLAAIALGLIDTLADAPARAAANPFAGVAALETSLRRYAKVSWALRLIHALRAKLAGELARVERGEWVEVDPKPGAATVRVQAPAAPRPSPAPPSLTDRIAAEMARLKAVLAGAPEALRESERELLLESEREDFGRHLSPRAAPDDDEFAEILKRPTEEIIALIREALGLPPEDDEDGETPEVPFALDGGRMRDGRAAASGGPPPS